jgi:hypothetical protein
MRGFYPPSLSLCPSEVATTGDVAHFILTPGRLPLVNSAPAISPFLVFLRDSHVGMTAAVAACPATWWPCAVPPTWEAAVLALEVSTAPSSFGAFLGVSFNQRREDDEEEYRRWN